MGEARESVLFFVLGILLCGVAYFISLSLLYWIGGVSLLAGVGQAIREKGMDDDF